MKYNNFSKAFDRYTEAHKRKYWQYRLGKHWKWYRKHFYKTHNEVWLWGIYQYTKDFGTSNISQETEEWINKLL